MVSIENESFSGSQISLNTPSGKYSGKVPFFGAHAIENFTAALLLGSTVNKKIWSSDTWNLVEQIPGRLEKIAGENGIVAFVDYAHTPDALEKTLLFLEKYKKSKISVVFGCGGDRDAGKRPLMGKIAAGIADRIYVTSDNPRTENPDQIITDILSGISPRDKVTVQPDRRLAIQSAVSDSSPDDIILIAGKGHETYQIIGDKILPFDDREVVREFLNPK